MTAGKRPEDFTLGEVLTMLEAKSIVREDVINLHYRLIGMAIERMSLKSQDPSADKPSKEEKVSCRRCE